MENVWVDLHPLLANNVKYDLGDYGRISTNNYVIKGDDFEKEVSSCSNTYEDFACGTIC